MSRRHAAEKREVVADAKYNDVVVAKFMNSLMLAGKKSVAEAILYGAMAELEEKINICHIIRIFFFFLYFFFCDSPLFRPLKRCRRVRGRFRKVLPL